MPIMNSGHLTVCFITKRLFLDGQLKLSPTSTCVAVGVAGGEARVESIGWILRSGMADNMLGV